MPSRRRSLLHLQPSSVLYLLSLAHADTLSHSVRPDEQEGMRKQQSSACHILSYHHTICFPDVGGSRGRCCRVAPYSVPRPWVRCVLFWFCFHWSCFVSLRFISFRSTLCTRSICLFRFDSVQFVLFRFSSFRFVSFRFTLYTRSFGSFRFVFCSIRFVSFRLVWFWLMWFFFCVVLLLWFRSFVSFRFVW